MCALHCAPIEMPFGLWSRMSPRNHVQMEVQIHSRKGGILKGESKALQKRLNRSICRLDVDSGWPKEACIRWGAHWRHLANTTEPFVCGGDAACCQITLTTCYYSSRLRIALMIAKTVMLCTCSFVFSVHRIFRRL